MTRKNRSPEENARRAKIRKLLLSSNISSMDDIQDLFSPPQPYRSLHRRLRASLPATSCACAPSTPHALHPEPCCSRCIHP